MSTAQARSYRDLERLSALETLKTLAQPDQVKLASLVAHLEKRGLWTQFSKITLGDLREVRPKTKSANNDEEALTAMGTRRRRRKMISTDGPAASEKAKEKREVADGGVSTDHVAGMVLPFVEGNGDVTLDDLEDYTQLELKVLRFHMGELVKKGKLERMGSGRNAVYSSPG